MLEFITETENCWDYLKNCQLPIFIYGMGDGALKIMDVLKEKSIAISGFFASDEFVRGHYFEKHKVHSLKEIESFLDNFVIVLAFAASYPSLIEKISILSQKYPLVAPDVPVAGNGLFTYEYCLEHSNEISAAYALFHDNISRKVFSDVINFKISGKIKYLQACTTPRTEVFSTIIHYTNAEIFLDLGAYNGDTVQEFLELTNYEYSKIIAVEPDVKNFKKLSKATANLENITAIQACAWCEDRTLNFKNKSGRQSSISTIGTEISARSVDSILNAGSCTTIKIDVEGSEQMAILGAKLTLDKFSPKLMVSLYHRNEDIFTLPLLINKLNSSYIFFLRHHPYVPAWETNLYAIHMTDL